MFWGLRDGSAWGFTPDWKYPPRSGFIFSKSLMIEMLASVVAVIFVQNWYLMLRGKDVSIQIIHNALELLPAPFTLVFKQSINPRELLHAL